MTLKSLFFGSTAVIAAATGAQAADPVVIVEPVAPNYVEVCDAFGAGFFYIPGTETCLDIGGYVRFQVDADENDWGVMTRGHLEVSAKTDTELGVLTSQIEINANAYSDNRSNETKLDNAYVELGGFQAGYFDTYWDEGLTGEVDDLEGSTKITEMRYVFANDGFILALALDALEADQVNVRDTSDTDMNKLGVAGRIGFAAGGINAKLDVGYDTYNEEAAFRALTEIAAGPGSVLIGLNYATGESAYARTWNVDYAGLDDAYYGYNEWAVAAGYRLNVTDKFRVTPMVQYSKIKTNNDLGIGDDPDVWSGGAYFEYEIVQDFWAKLNVQYADLNSDLKNYAGGVDGSDWSGYFRLQRDF